MDTVLDRVKLDYNAQLYLLPLPCKLARIIVIRSLAHDAYEDLHAHSGPHLALLRFDIPALQARISKESQVPKKVHFHVQWAAQLG